MAAAHYFPFGPPVDPSICPVRLYGGPRVTEDEKEIELTPFQASFVAVICVAGPLGISRRKLAWLLWECEDDGTTRHRISQLLYQLGGRLTEAPVAAERDMLKPSPSFESDLGKLRLTGATRPVTGAPFGRLKAPHPTRAFEEWLTNQRTNLRYLAIERNGELLARAEEDHDYGLAADAAKGVLEYDPVNERALRSLIRALALGASAIQAEAAYERQAEVCMKILDDWKPSRETRRLLSEVDSLKERQQDRPTPGEDQHPVRLVGRKSELMELKRLCLGSGDGWQDAVIRGESGMGKSRLLEELARQLELEDCRLVRVKSFSAEEGIAFNLLSDIAKSEPLQEAVRTLPPLWRKVLATCLTVAPVDVPKEALPEIPPDSASRRIYEALRVLFESAEGRIVILADGFGAADSSSLAALSFLRQRIERGVIRFIGTVSHEALRRNDSQTTYLRELIDQIDNKIEIKPLDEDESRELVEAVGGGGDCDALLRMGGGNPLYLVELARAGGPAMISVPPSLDALIQRTMRGLAEHTRAYINILSAQREPLAIQLIAAIGRQSPAQVLASISEARSRRILHESGGAIGFRHGLFRLWVYRGLTDAERNYIHGLTATALSRSKSPSAPELAYHLEAAGRAVEAHEWAGRAADEAIERAAFPTALAMLAIAARTAPDETVRGDLEHRAAQLCFLQGDSDGALNIVENSAAIRASLSDDGQILRSVAAAEIGKIRPAEALDQLISIRDASLEGRTPTLLYLRAADAALIVANEHLLFENAHQIIRDIDTLEPVSDPRIACGVELVRSFHFLFGERRVGIRAADRALDLASANDLRDERMTALTRHVIVHSWEGDLDVSRVSSHLSQVEAEARQSGDKRHLLRCILNLCTWHLDVGEPDAAHNLLLRAEQLAGSADPAIRVGLNLNWGEYYLYTRKFDNALGVFRELCALGEALRTDHVSSAWAGLGLAALELGQMEDLQAAEARTPSLEEVLGSIINIDPTLMIRFRSRRLEQMRRVPQAVETIEAGRRALEGTCIPGWLKLGILQGRVHRKHRLRASADFLERELGLARELGLTTLADRLASLV